MGDEQRDEREWRIAKIVETNEEATLVAGFLNSNDIPAEVESLHVEELPVNLGGLGEVRVRVPADRLDEARALLDASEVPGTDDAVEAAAAAATETAATETAAEAGDVEDRQGALGPAGRGDPAA
ncbi:MAG: hypothetical protein JOZ15_18275 [Acidobacteria bacterium]|nr:hypothetical protein [Acidobacteriota bacterium]